MAVARNVLIVLAIAAVVAFVPGGWPAALVIGTLFSILLLAGLLWFAGRMYLEHRIDLFGLGDRNRALLYGAIAVVALTLTGSDRLFSTGIGTIAWLALIGASVLAVFTVWRNWRAYD
jgi:hypothetical protein